MPYQSLGRPMDSPDFGSQPDPQLQTQQQTQARPLCSIMKLKNKLLLLNYNNNNNWNNNNGNNCNGNESMERKVHYVIRRAQFIAFNGKKVGREALPINSSPRV